MGMEKDPRVERYRKHYDELFRKLAEKHDLLNYLGKDRTAALVKRYRGNFTT